MNNIEIRIAVEKAIVQALFEELAKEGWTPYETDMGDGPEPTKTFEDAFNEVFACDDGRVYLKNKRERAWVLIVLGNGVKCVSDFTINISPPCERIYNRIEKGGFTVTLNKVSKAATA